MIYERSVKMAPLFVNTQNANRYRIANDSINNLLPLDDEITNMFVSSNINTINNDIFDRISVNSINSFLAENTFQTTTLLARIVKMIGKNLGYLVATSGNIVAQMIISTTVAKTPWNSDTIKNSIKFSFGIIALDTLCEPYIFSSFVKIKQWIVDKWNSNENYSNLITPLLIINSVLPILSYISVLLDRGSNSILDEFISVAIIGETVVEFISYVINMALHSAIIFTTEKILTITYSKLKKLFKQNNVANPDLESQLLTNNQQNNNAKEEKNTFSKEDILSLSLIPVSLTITWTTENCISNQQFTWDKFVTDIPKVTGAVTLSLFSSLLNCMVNGEEIPFFPMSIMRVIKRWCGYQTNAELQQLVISNATSISDEVVNSTSQLFRANSTNHLASDSIVIAKQDFKKNDNSLVSSVETETSFQELVNEEAYPFKNAKLSFTSDEDDEIFFDAVEEQEVENNADFNNRLINNYGTLITCISNSTSSADSGISSAEFETSSEEPLSQSKQLLIV